jgi:hypothetical protein
MSDTGSACFPERRHQSTAPRIALCQTKSWPVVACAERFAMRSGHASSRFVTATARCVRKRMDPLLAHTRQYRVAPSTSRPGPVRCEPISRRQRRVVCSVLDAARSCFGTMKRSSLTRYSLLRLLWTRRYRRMNNVISTPPRKLPGTRLRTCGHKANGIEYQQCGVTAAWDGIESPTSGFSPLRIPPRVGLRCLRLARGQLRFSCARW